MVMAALRLLRLLVCCFIISAVVCVGDKVSEAINICREKLKADPHFPRVQYSLAQLLDSKILGSDDNVDKTLVAEVLHLYSQVGNPHDSVEEKRIPPIKVRFESLMRAAHIAKDILRDNRQAVSYYEFAMHIDGIDCPLLLVAFEETLKLLLSSITATLGESFEVLPTGILGGNESNHDPLQLSLQLCDYVGTKCPNEPLVDEFRGATLRQLKHGELAYQSYMQAWIKSREHYHNCSTQQSEVDECYVQLKIFLKTAILAAAAAREAGISYDDQMSYLTEVETYAIPVLVPTKKHDDVQRQMKKDDLVKEIVELYNNMGILEKKRGSLSQAKMLFRKALDINPTDGHALVQLASISSQDEDGQIISEVKRLDPEYVVGLFDGYASRFESELVDVLKYTGHLLVYDSLRNALDPNAKYINTIIDIGCGTGLLGELIAREMPWVAIHGTDLSQRMVEISRERKTDSGGKRSVYKTVSNLDASEFLSTFGRESVDCVVASDVFIYIGDISTVLENCSKCLVERGLIGFTIEKHELLKNDSTNGLTLLPSGRFGHSKEYIYQMAENYGFKIHSWRDVVLRQQAGSDVDGAVVIMQKERRHAA